MTFNLTPTATPARQGLNDFGLTDESPWPDLDDLTIVASRLLDAAQSVILIVEDPVGHHPVGRHRVGHHRFSCHPDDGRDLQSLLLSASARVVAKDQPVAVCDRDSYLGVPIHDSTAKPIGVLCVVDQGPRSWSDRDRADLQRLARGAANAIELKVVRLSEQGRRDEHLHFAAALIEDFNVSIHSAHLLANDLEAELPPAVRPPGLQDTIDLAARISESLQGIGAGLHRYLEVLQTSTPHDEEVDLEDVIDEVISDLAPQLNRPTVSTRLGPLPPVRGDAAQLKILFKNLLTDSLRRRRELVALHISVTTAPCPSTDRIRIRVTDNGRTEPRSTREELLDFLVRLDQPGQSRESSTNIDLCTNTRVVASHQGNLSFTTGPEVSTAIVDLRAWR